MQPLATAGSIISRDSQFGQARSGPGILVNSLIKGCYHSKGSERTNCSMPPLCGPTEPTLRRDRIACGLCGICIGTLFTADGSMAKLFAHYLHRYLLDVHVLVAPLAPHGFRKLSG